jgi:HAD superfamily hydrolase (TIGR01509 family)
VGAVIFDCDGVLVDSEPLALEVMLAELQRIGLALPAAEIHARFTGRSLEDCERQIAELAGPERTAGFAARFERRLGAVFASRLEPVPGAPGVLDTLRSAGVPVAVASSGSHAKIARSLQLTGLAGFFPPERVFSAADVPLGKPAPDLFLHAARCLNLEPGDCLAVEDSTPGLAAAAAAGMRVLALIRPGTPPVTVPAGVEVIDTLAAVAARAAAAGSRRRVP